ncbi:MAG: TAXI family TRAP transporter solute-binding subunit [Lautropia sp.]
MHSPLRRILLNATAVLPASLALPARAEIKRITIGTNPVGTFYYVLGGGLAKLFSEELGIRSIVQPYAGSSVYLPMIDAGDVTMGLSSSLDSGGAYRGEQGRDRNRNLRSLARLWPLRYALVVRKDSPIRTPADLKGKRVVINFKANVSLSPIHHAVLKSAGLTDKDVVAVDVAGLPQGIKGVVDGSIDATWAAVGIPAIKEAHAAVGVRYVELAGPNFTETFLDNEVPGLFPIGIAPAPNLPEVDAPLTTTGFDVFLVGSSTLDDATVGKLLGTIHSAFGALQKDYPTMRQAKIEDMGRASNTVPYHPGAVAFYKSKGLWTPANDEKQKRVTMA